MEFIKKNKILILVLIAAFLSLCFSVGHVANIYIDVGREAYYPKAILEGKILYKDLFCIYGPLSYLFNALIYKIFGAKLTTLYFSGGLCALLIVSFIYLISKKFLSLYITTVISIFTIITGCLATRIFNFTFPYSYAVLYGLCAFLISLYFLILYTGDKKEYKLIISSALAGIAFANKYDFIPFIIPLSVIILRTKNLKLVLKSYCALLLSFLFPFVVLIFQGMTFSDILNMAVVIKDFTTTEAMKTFYTSQGVYYTNKVWAGWADSIIFLSIYFVFIISGVFLFCKKNVFLKILGAVIVLLTVFSASPNIRQTDYLFMTFLVCAFFILRFKKNSYIENIVILSVISISLKSMWGLSHVNYGLYYAACIFISFFILLKNNFNDKITNSISILLIAACLNFLSINLSWINNMNGKIETAKGNIVTIDNWAKTTNEIIEYINNLEEENPRIVILPEGLIINFLADKKNETEGFYNSLIPLYTEGFGEDKIIEHYKKNPPDYFIISNMETGSYDRGEICNTYGFGFCGFVLDNYIPVEKFENDEAKAVVFYKGSKL